MGSLTNYATTELVDHVFKATYSAITPLYLCLCTTTPTITSTGSDIVECNYLYYVRKSFAAGTFSAAASRKVVQGLDIEFATAGGASTLPINSYAICDASTGGNVLAFGSFNSSWNTVLDNTPKVASGEIEIEIGASSGAGFSNYTVHGMLNLMFRTTSWSSPSGSIYFGASTAVLTDTSTSATEPSGNNYSRVSVPASSFDAAALGVTTNNTLISYPAPSGSWGTVTTVPIFDASSNGNLLAYDNTNVSDQTITTGDVVQIAVGAFDCDLD